MKTTAFILIFLFASSWMSAQNRLWGNTYEEVKIGNQVWMARNLDVVTFRNGDTIPQATTQEAWQAAEAKKQPVWCYYNNDSTLGAVYGKLYNWHAVNDKRGLAPIGWHIPSGEEWYTLYQFLGGKKGQVGKKLKSSAGWSKQGNGDNSSGFNALPAGVRTFAMITPNNGYRWMGSLTIWWSTNKPKNWVDVHCFVLRSTDKAVFEWHEPWDGHSVRCVKD